MKIIALPKLVTIEGESVGHVTSIINDKEYVLNYRILPYFFEHRSGIRNKEKRIEIHFSEQNTLNSFGIEIDFTKVKWSVLRSVFRNLKEKTAKRIKERGEAYDKAPVHAILNELKLFLKDPFVYEGITINPIFHYQNKKEFCEGGYSSDDLSLFVTYEWDNNQKKQKIEFSITSKHTYRSYSNVTKMYDFKKNYTTFKGVWKQLGNIAIKIQEEVRDEIDRTNIEILRIKQHNASIMETKTELGDNVVEVSGHLSYRKIEPILEGEEYKKKSYQKEWKVDFSRGKYYPNEIVYSNIVLHGKYTVEQMKKIIEMGMEAMPDEVYKPA
jgi:hypothetical protein